MADNQEEKQSKSIVNGLVRYRRAMERKIK